MNKDVVTSDCWIMGQLAGIKMLERELTNAMKTPGGPKKEALRQRVAMLNSWVDLVDSVLAQRAQLHGESAAAIS